MRRHACGVLSVAFLCGAAYGLATYGVDHSQASMYSSMGLRMGLVLGAIWLAFPQLSKLTVQTSTWFLLLLGAIGLIIVARPRTVVVLGPVMLLLILLQFAGWLMKPPPRRTTARPRPRDGSQPPPL
jgi:hypothetical protein